MQISYLFFDAKKKIGQITVVLWRTRKRRKIFEQENIFISEEKEKEENIWRRKKKMKNGEGKLNQVNFQGYIVCR